MKKSIPLLIVLVASFLHTPHAEAFGRRPQKLGLIQAESEVPAAQITTLREDFDWLASHLNSPASSEMLTVMGLQDASPQSLSTWLNERVRYLVAEDFSPSILNVRPYFFKDFTYPATEMPDLEFPAGRSPLRFSPESSEKEDPIPAPKQAQVVMSNLGSGLYLAGKMSKVLLGVKIRGIGRIAVTSPRAGIIQVGEGLFSDQVFGPQFSKDSPILKTFRMSTFYHEARHSDGNGKSLGFPHALCPYGHDYAGLNACDYNLNGPYTVGALIAEHLSKSCTECPEAEREMIRMVGLESRGRVLKERNGALATHWNDLPEGVFQPE